jgi:hypothetical protein
MLALVSGTEERSEDVDDAKDSHDVAQLQAAAECFLLGATASPTPAVTAPAALRLLGLLPNSASPALLPRDPLPAWIVAVLLDAFRALRLDQKDTAHEEERDEEEGDVPAALSALTEASTASAVGRVEQARAMVTHALEADPADVLALLVHREADARLGISRSWRWTVAALARLSLLGAADAAAAKRLWSVPCIVAAGVFAADLVLGDGAAVVQTARAAVVALRSAGKECVWAPEDAQASDTEAWRRTAASFAAANLAALAEDRNLSQLQQSHLHSARTALEALHIADGTVHAGDGEFERSEFWMRAARAATDQDTSRRLLLAAAVLGHPGAHAQLGQLDGDTRAAAKAAYAHPWTE